MFTYIKEIVVPMGTLHNLYSYRIVVDNTHYKLIWVT